MNLAKLSINMRNLKVMLDRLMVETYWYPVLVIGILFGIIFTLTKLFL